MGSISRKDKYEHWIHSNYCTYRALETLMASDHLPSKRHPEDKFPGDILKQWLCTTVSQGLELINSSEDMQATLGTNREILSSSCGQLQTFSFHLGFLCILKQFFVAFCLEKNKKMRWWLTMRFFACLLKSSPSFVQWEVLQVYCT